MSVFLSYLIIPIILLTLVLNGYFRLKIIKNYKKLSRKNAKIEPGLIFSKTKDEAFIRKHYPEEADQIIAFSKHIKTMIIIASVGFLLILFIFLFVYFTKA